MMSGRGRGKRSGRGGRGGGRGRGRGKSRGRGGRGDGRGRGQGHSSHLPRRYNPKDNLRNLILSCENGHVNDLRTLLRDHSCNPNMFGSRKAMKVSTGDPLGYYVFKHHRKVKKGHCKRIIVDTDRTPLHICIRKGFDVCARLLLNGGASLEEPGKNGLSATALMHSMRPGWCSWWPKTPTVHHPVEQMEAAEFQEHINEDDYESSVEDEEYECLEEASAAASGKEEKSEEIDEVLADEFGKLMVEGGN